MSGDWRKNKQKKTKRKIEDVSDLNLAEAKDPNSTIFSLFLEFCSTEHWELGLGDGGENGFWWRRQCKGDDD